MNRRELLRQALDSLARQTRPCTQAIVIDAGSDGSHAIARSYPFVQYVRQQTRGLTAARNEALAAATADYVGMLDSDDLYEPGFLAACAALLDREPELSVVYTRGRTIDANGRTIGTSLQGHRCPLDPVRSLLIDNFVVASFSLMRKAAVSGVGGYDESLTWADDYELFLRIALQGGRFAHVPHILAARRRHDGSLTAAFPAESIEAIRRILESHADAIRVTTGQDVSRWMAGVNYRAGRVHFESGDLETARALFREASAAGHELARRYSWWCRWHRWVSPPLVALRHVKRFVVRGLGHAGLVENRWA